MREIICTNAIRWLEEQPDNSLPSAVTGIPDTHTIQKDMTTAEYMQFIRIASSLIMKKVRPDQYCIFILTDRKGDGIWIDKGHQIIDMALSLDMKQLWHKIIVNKQSVNFIMASYSHFLCFSKAGTPGKPTPDVMERGDIVYRYATGQIPTRIAIEFLAGKTDTVLDPFVGQGTVVAMANAYGMKGIGIDIDPEQCEKAKLLKLEKPI